MSKNIKESSLDEINDEKNNQENSIKDEKKLEKTKEKTKEKKTKEEKNVKQYSKEKTFYRISRITSLVLLLIVFPILMFSIGMSSIDYRNEKTNIEINIEDGIYPDNNYDVISENNWEKYFDDDDYWIVHITKNSENEYRVTQIFIEEKTTVDNAIESIKSDTTDENIMENMIVLINEVDLVDDIYDFDINQNYTIYAKNYLPNKFFSDLKTQQWIIITSSIYFGITLIFVFSWFWFSKHNIQNLEGEEN